MPKQRIFSVHQRSTLDMGLERELAVFTDDNMANQAIDHLYRWAWNDIVMNKANPYWFHPELSAEIKAQGFDTWAVNNKNGLAPIFFKKPHDLWNQVPPNAAGMNFTQEIVDHGAVPVVEVKKLFA